MFKLGDVVRGRQNNGYLRTTYPYLCKVIEVSGNAMQIQLIDGPWINATYVVSNSNTKFDLIKTSKNNTSIFN